MVFCEYFVSCEISSVFSWVLLKLWNIVILLLSTSWAIKSRLASSKHLHILIWYMVSGVLVSSVLVLIAGVLVGSVVVLVVGVLVGSVVILVVGVLVGSVVVFVVGVLVGAVEGSSTVMRRVEGLWAVPGPPPGARYFPRRVVVTIVAGDLTGWRHPSPWKHYNNTQTNQHSRMPVQWYLKSTVYI